MIRRFPDSEILDDALMDLAKAYYLTKDYPQAIYEIRRLQRDYPESPLTEEAQYYMGLCYFRQSKSAQLDQQETHYAMDEFKLYLAVLQLALLYAEHVGANIFEIFQKSFFYTSPKAIYIPRYELCHLVPPDKLSSE